MRGKFLLKGATYSLSILWTALLVLKSFETPCFNMFDAYMTIITIFASMMFNDLIG